MQITFLEGVVSIDRENIYLKMYIQPYIRVSDEGIKCDKPIVVTLYNFRIVGHEKHVSDLL